MKNPLIISRPDLQTLRQKYAFAFLTFLFWLIWFYLWLPLISLLAWLFGVEIIYEHMIVLEGFYGLVDLLGWYLSVILLIGLTLLCWSRYNLTRFRGRSKRTHVDTVSGHQLADFFNVDRQSVDASRHARTIYVSHDANGQIDHIRYDESTPRD